MFGDATPTTTVVYSTVHATGLLTSAYNILKTHKACKIFVSATKNSFRKYRLPPGDLDEHKGSIRKPGQGQINGSTIGFVNYSSLKELRKFFVTTLSVYSFHKKKIHK